MIEPSVDSFGRPERSPTPFWAMSVYIPGNFTEFVYVFRRVGHLRHFFSVLGTWYGHRSCVLPYSSRKRRMVFCKRRRWWELPKVFSSSVHDEVMPSHENRLEIASALPIFFHMAWRSDFGSFLETIRDIVADEQVTPWWCFTDWLSQRKNSIGCIILTT